jgi:hypothetical protein
MKKILILVLLVTVAVIVTPSFAQVNVDDQLEVMRGQVEADRKEIIALNLKLTEQESKDFWPIYNRYRDEMKVVNDRMFALISKYAENYANLSDAVAAELMVEAMDIEEDRMIYKKIYVEELLDILPTKKVAMLFQIENKIEAAVKYELTQSIPFVNLPENAEKKDQ